MIFFEIIILLIRQGILSEIINYYFLKIIIPMETKKLIIKALKVFLILLLFEDYEFFS
jgi:hypothetical protein